MDDLLAHIIRNLLGLDDPRATTNVGGPIISPPGPAPTPPPPGGPPRPPGPPSEPPGGGGGPPRPPGPPGGGGPPGKGATAPGPPGPPIRPGQVRRGGIQVNFPFMPFVPLPFSVGIGFGAFGGAGGSQMAVPIAAKVYRAAGTQVIADNPIPSVALTMDTVEYDPGGFFNIAFPTRLTVPVGQGGVPYVIMGGTFTNNNPAADCLVALWKNGAALRGGSETFPNTNSVFNPGQPVGYIPAQTVIDVPNDGDYYEIRVYIDNNGANMTFGHLTDTSAESWIGLMRLANTGAAGPAGATGPSGTAGIADRANMDAGNFTSAAVGYVDVPALTLSPTLIGANRVLVVLSGGASCLANKYGVLDLKIDGVSVTGGDGLVIFGPTAAAANWPITFAYISDPLTAALHSFQVQLKSPNGASVTIYGGAGGGPNSYLSVYELPGT